MEKKIIIQALDGVELSGIYRYTDQNRIAILMHMMPAVKESWDGFADTLFDQGVASLAFDARGHGESTMGGTLDYKLFTQEQHLARRLDVESALSYARAQGFDDAHTILIGASIGANLAITTMQTHSAIPLAIALSPGLDYHGIKTIGAIETLLFGQKVVLVASDDDDYSWKTCMELHTQNSAQTIFVERSGLGHGTHMIDKDETLVQSIVKQLV